MNIYENLQVKEKTEKAIDKYVENALACLHAVSVDEEKKQQLYDLANALVKRDK